MIRKNVFILQHDSTDCAAACLSMVCYYYNKKYSIAKLRDIIGTDIKGSTLFGIEKSANMLGFDTKSIKVNTDSFVETYSLPAIAHTITKEGLAHFVVIRKIKNSNVWITDPAKGKKKLSTSEFFQTFTGILLLLLPNETFTTTKEKTTSVSKRFKKIILKQKKLFICAIIASFLLTFLGIITSFFNKYLLDSIIPFKLEKELLSYTLIFGLIVITQIGIRFLRNHLILHISQKIDFPLMLDFFTHIFYLPMKFFSSRKTGDILTRFSDSLTIKNVLTELYLTVLIDVFMAIASGITLYIMNKTLFLIIVILTVLSAILVFAFKRIYKDTNLASMEQSARVNSDVIEKIKAIETIKANTYENNVLDKLESEYKKSLRIQFKQGWFSNLQSSISEGVGLLGNIALLFIGAQLIINQDITIGTFMSFITLSTLFMQPIGRLIKAQLSIQETNIAMERISEILDIQKERPHPHQLSETIEDNDQTPFTPSYTVKLQNINNIVLNDITFSYGYRQPILKEFNLTIQKGKKVALVGQSGSGKTTIAKLLLKFLDIQSGSIYINGVDIKDIDIESLRNCIAYVPQNIELFSDSIINNIKVGNPQASLEDIKAVCELTGCDEFINRLPAGYQSFLDESGGGLSGGEKQRLALARAIIKDSNFFILDEATSNLDFMSESKIHQTIFHHLKEKTVLIIAHRLSTIRNCDIICVMENGEIKEQGTHEELLNQGGIYYDLWNSQIGVTSNAE